MTDTIRAPWTPEQVDALNRFQRHGGMHPFACGNEHPAHPNAILTATVDGWRCFVTGCDWEQDWAHAFMADPAVWPRPMADQLRITTAPTCGEECAEGHTYAGWYAQAGDGTTLDQSGIHTPGCDCDHDGMGRGWHARDCAWRARTTQDNPAASDDGLCEQYAAALRNAQREWMRPGSDAGQHLMTDHMAGAVLAVRDRRMEQLAAERDMLGRESDRLRTDWVTMRTRAETADAVTAETKRLMERRTNTLRERAETAEATVTRVIALHEQWTAAGPPPLGTSINRWWDRRLAELHQALTDPAPAEQPPPAPRHGATIGWVDPAEYEPSAGEEAPGA